MCSPGRETDLRSLRQVLVDCQERAVSVSRLTGMKSMVRSESL